MDKSTQKKRQAQKLAQGGSHREAADIYAKLALDGKLEPYDLVVFGDLLFRSGNKDEGVERYVEALDSYSKAGLHRNAIALAKKVQRLATDYHVAHRKLGELYAAEGLASESCLHYLEYLETLNQGGELDADEVEQVCISLLSLSLPSFKVVDRVVLIAEKAGRADRLAEGLLQQAERARTLGNSSAQEEFTRKALELDPNVNIPAPRQPGESGPTAAPDVFLDPGAVHLVAAPPEAPEIYQAPEETVLSFDPDEGEAPNGDTVSVQEPGPPALDPGDISLSGPGSSEVEFVSIDDADSLEDAMAAFNGPGEDDPIADPESETGEIGNVASPSLVMDINDGLTADLETLRKDDNSGELDDPSPSNGDGGAEATELDLIGTVHGGESTGALDTAEQSPESDPDRLRARGLELLQTDEPHRAQREFMKAARIFFELGRSQDAAELYTRVIQMDPNHLDALRGMVEITHINGEKAKMAHWGCELGDVLLAREIYPEAKYQFERVLAFDPENAKARSRVKRLNTMAGVQDSGYGELTPTASEVEGAQVTVRDEDEPKSGQSVFDLSEILEEFRASVVEHIPDDDTQSHYDLGMTYMEMGLHEEAVQEFALSSDDEAVRLGSMEMMAECYRILERYEESVAVLVQIAGEGDAGVQARTALNLGRCVEAMGEWDKAEEYYYSALELDGDLDEATQAIESLERRREQGAA